MDCSTIPGDLAALKTQIFNWLLHDDLWNSHSSSCRGKTKVTKKKLKHKVKIFVKFGETSYLNEHNYVEMYF